MNPTHEQVRAVYLASSEPQNDLKIEAFAGAGKTTTLKGIADARGGRGLYLAFNRAIKDEAAEKFPSSVLCKTAHGLAFGPVGRLYADRLNGRILPRMLVERYQINDIGKTSAYGLATFALRTVNAFCQSGDPSIDLIHLPNAATRKAQVAQTVQDIAGRLWVDMEVVGGDLPVTHDFYLKKWALSQPRLPAEFILFDEAQDANGVMLSVVCPQDAQKIYVGDRFQQIYGWRGAVNAMQTIDTWNACQITKSFRFGQAIADAGNLVLNTFLQADVAIQGFEQCESRLDEVERPDAYLFRTNGCLIGQLVDYLDADEPPVVAVTGGTRELVTLIDGAEMLKNGQRTYIPDLAAFETWQELEEYAESEIGGDLAPLVRLMERDVREIRRALDIVSSVQERDADVVLSTAHKAKGREWHTVRLANDFQAPDPENPDDFNPEEANLLYVACTRAKEVLDVTHCDAYHTAKELQA